MSGFETVKLQRCSVDPRYGALGNEVIARVFLSQITLVYRTARIEQILLFVGYLAAKQAYLYMYYLRCAVTVL